MPSCDAPTKILRVRQLCCKTSRPRQQVRGEETSVVLCFGTGSLAAGIQYKSKEKVYVFQDAWTEPDVVCGWIDGG